MSVYTYKADIVNVVDGDTVDARIHANADVGFNLKFDLAFIERLRLLGVNCPEVHGATRAAGLAAKAFTTARLLGKTVTIRTEKGDSFDRWLASVTLDDGTDFSAALIDAGHAVPFMVGRAPLRAIVEGEDD